MEDIDDDFGDLYADVELQSSTSNKCTSNFSGLCIEQDDNDTERIDSGPKNVDELIQEDNGSDSEDDLNIVLNDDDVNLRSGGFDEEEKEDGGGFEVVAAGDGLENSPNGGGGGERGNGVKGSYQFQYLQHKYIRPHTAASLPTNSKANGSVGVGSYSSTSVRGDWGDNEYNQRMASSSLVAQRGHNFSLPWYRTILDVNIDTFERKPWRHPGADTTDFFNFSFDEENWKLYCDNLEQLRQQTSLLSRTSVYEFSNPKAYESGAEYETGAREAVPEEVSHIRQRGIVSTASKIPYREMKPKGRVIQVEGSILERQPSMDVRRLVDRDSDVIQIAVQDSMEDSYDSGKEELTHKDGSAHEASENGACDVDDDKVIHHFGSGSGDELSKEFSEGNVRRPDRPFPKRCSLLTTPSNPVCVDSDSHGSGQISDVDGHCNQKVTVSSSEGNAEAMETSDNKKEKVCRDTCNTAPSMGKTESLLGEQSKNDPSSSYSGSHCEAYGDSASTDPKRIQNHLRRQSPNSVTELRESVTSDYHHSNDSKTYRGGTKSRDCKYNARNRSPIAKDLKHYSRKLHSVSELKSHHDYDDAPPLSNTDRIGDAYYSAVRRRRQDKRLHGFDSYDREDFSYHKESKLSSNYYGERFSYNPVHAAYSRKPHRNRHSFGDETDHHLSRWDEEEYFLKQRISREDDDVMRRDWPRYERGLALNPLICKDSRRLTSNYSSYLDKERVTRWRRKGDELQFRKRREKDDFLFDHQYQDDKYECYDQERKYLDDKYERPLPSTRRGENSSGRSERKCDSLSNDLDNLWSMSNADEYWRYTNPRSLYSRSYRESHTGNRRRGLDTISLSNAYGPTLTERHERYTGRISKESRGSDWFSSNHYVGDTEGSANYPDGQVHFGRRRHWQYESFYWAEDEYISRHEDDEFLAEASFSFGGTSRHRRFDGKRKLIDDGEVEHRRIKLTREGNISNRIDRSSNIIRRGNHEKIFLRDRDSGDLQLVVREGKSSGRCSNAGSIVCNDKHENMDWNIVEEQKISVDFNESLAEKEGLADKSKAEINWNDEKWLDKFSVTPHNEVLDIEEGQIITEEGNLNPVDENFGFEDVAEISDEKKILHDKNAAKENKVGEGYDNTRILEVIAKMEKRRERFKEPVTLKKETDRIPMPQVDPVVETIEAKQQRPARKRRWG